MNTKSPSMLAGADEPRNVNLGRLITPRETWGQWVKRKRLELGFRVMSDIARQAGMSPQQWSRMEHDLPRPSSGRPPRPQEETVWVVARALGVPVAEALIAAGYNSEVELTNDTSKSVASLLEECPSWFQRSVYRQVREMYSSLYEGVQEEDE